jgi:hypothetical protein
MRCVFFLQNSNLHPNKQKYKSEKETLYFYYTKSNILKQTWCLSICVFVTDIHGLRPGQPLRGPGEVPRPFIHPMWMRDAVWGQTVCSASQTKVHRARWVGQTGLDSAHRTCRGASQCSKVTNIIIKTENTYK